MKKIISALTAMLMLTLCVGAASAAGKTYTFSGFNLAKPSGTEDVQNAKLTDDITVTTGGLMNWKAAAVTDIKHNEECGFYPIGGNFNPKGSYIYLAVGNSNNASLFTLNMPKIEKGSEVTITFAKPVITNNGSTRRNENDPYAYFKIADRYISINGGEFDTWRTESVVTGEDTDAIEFYCDQWGAVAIQKIEVTSGKNTPLYSLDVQTAQYANLTVNGIKFYADGEGSLHGPSFADGEEITITAQKDGYKDASSSVKINGGNVTAKVYPECELDAKYYESDFGTVTGTLELDNYPLNIERKPVTRFFAQAAFSDNGSLTLTGDTGEIITLTKKNDGIYADGTTFITSKDNMEFEIFFDSEEKIAAFRENGEYHIKNGENLDFNKITGLSGSNVTMDYLGVSYPDMSKITIEGPDTVSSLADGKINTAPYRAVLEYERPGAQTEWTFNGETVEEQNVTNALIAIPSGMSGAARLEFKCGDYSTYKDINVVKNPKLTDIEHTGRTLNLYDSARFTIDSAKDELGNKISVLTDSTYILKDFKSSDESVIKIDENGMMTAVGAGEAVISANAYTGADNPISVKYTVENYAITGFAGGNGIAAYEVNDLVKNEHITGYKIIHGNEGDIIEPTQIPAATVKSDGVVITAAYNNAGLLYYARKKNVKAGDKIEISTAQKNVYFRVDGKIEKVTESDTTTEGFEIKLDAYSDYKIAPVYTFTDIGDVAEGKTLDASFAGGRYDITFKKAETWRGDILVNGAMVGNNVDQADADRKVTDGAEYTAERLLINEGDITVSMTDGSTMLDYVTVEPAAYENRVFVIGDSLACEYYGDFDKEVGGGRSGWGQHLGDFINLPITNLANSGQYAKGLYDTAFKGVMKYAMPGDILLIECGYNDRNYSTREEMTETVKSMITECRAKRIVPVLVTPNASKHDYKPSVAWSGYMRDIAADMKCDIIDLSKLSYDFLYSLYGDDSDDVVTKNFNLTEVGGDTLHSSYAGAYVWASMVAQGLKDFGYEKYGLTTTDFEYSFTDTIGNKITAKVK